jgi:hypothetical protein
METYGVADLAGLSARVEYGSVAATGTISAVDGASVSVLCDSDAGSEPGVYSVVVRVFAPDALYRLSGSASVSGRDVVTGQDTSVERIQRRRWPRRRVDLAVTVFPVTEGVKHEGVPGRSVDLSVGGLCVETLRPVEGDDDPILIISLPDGTSVVSGASMVCVEDLGDGWRYRLAFRELESHDAGRLAELTSDDAQPPRPVVHHGWRSH